MNLQERNEDVRQFFDERIDTYDDVHAKFMPTKMLMTAAMTPNTAEVLDLGAGTGLELIALFQRFPKAHVTAIDLSAIMLERLQKRPFADRVTCKNEDFYAADYGKGLDAVISTSALHHFTHEEKLLLLKKAHEALKPGGMLINCDKIVFTAQEEADNFEHYDEYHKKWPHVDTPMTPEHEKQLLLLAGFSRVELRKTPVDNYRLMIAHK